MLNIMLGIASLVIQALVVYYGWKMYRILNPVRYWSNAWFLYSLANLMILIRRVIELFTSEWFITYSPKTLLDLALYTTTEYIIQIVVSILLLVFGKNLNSLYSKYFCDGLKVGSWRREQEEQKEKN